VNKQIKVEKHVNMQQGSKVKRINK